MIELIGNCQLNLIYQQLILPNQIFYNTNFITLTLIKSFKKIMAANWQAIPGANQQKKPSAV